MNESEARALVRETFAADFDRQQFALFINHLLKNVDASKQFQIGGNRVRQAFQDKVLSYERLGTYTDTNSDKVDVLIVNLRNKETLERARKGLRNFVADYLQSDRGFNKSAVLAAYVVKDEAGNYISQTEWRFSYVTLEKNLRLNEKGKFKEEVVRITPARRFSFLVGAGEKTNTAQNQFSALLKSSSSPTLRQIEDAFSIDKLNRDFYNHYERLLGKVSAALIKVRKKNRELDTHWHEKFFEDEDVTNEEHDPHKKTKDFAKKLLGQVIFLYFLQRKGWLGVKRHQQYGEGDRNFLKHIFTARLDDYRAYAPFRNRTKSFFNDVLKHIFYDALAIEHTRDIFSNSDFRFPFLNGGLFEAKFDWNEYDILLPDDVFSNNERDGDEIGTGIFDVFDRFNFTANESEPSEVEVAIDPEMLGRIFENQLLKEERGSKGAFYTPRVIVNYMCRESLLNYLATHFQDRTLKPRPARLRVEAANKQATLNDADERHTAPPSSSELRAFVSFADSSRDYQQGGAIVDADRKFPPSIIQHAREIDWLLSEVKICDPAIGSGAFPVGLLQEIVRLREAIAPVIESESDGKRLAFDEDDYSLIYQLKLHAIQNSIYGVDIEPSAVDIARLRLWLSLIVDEQERRKVRALPNLDYKIMQGNSLLEEFGGVRLVPEDVFKRRVRQTGRVKSDEEKFLETLHAEAIKVRAKEGNTSIRALKITREIEQLERVIARKKTAPAAAQLQESMAYDVSENERYFAEIERVHREFFAAQSETLKRDLRRELELAILRYVNNHLNEQEARLEATIANLNAELKAEEKNVRATLKSEVETAKIKRMRRDLETAESDLEHLTATRVELKKLWLIDDSTNADKDLANIRLSNLTEAQTKPFFLWEIQFLEVFRGNGGFDIVIANPPYIRQERITRHKDALKRAFPEVYAGTADILVYFYARGFEILRDKGTLAFITSNKYFRAGYGERLREFLGSQTKVLQLIDFGDAPVFEAAAYASIIMLQKERVADNQTQAWTFPQNEIVADFEDGFQRLGFALPQRELKREGWRLEAAHVLRLLERIKSKGRPLGEYVNGKFYRGILTGFNEAFIVNEETKEKLIAEDKSSRKILKPFLRGRNVKRWLVEYENLYLIKIESSSNQEHAWSGKPVKEAEKIFAETYPAIHQRFQEYRPDLIKREDKGMYFWELRACKYWDEFEKAKIVIPAIERNAAYAIDEKGFFSNDKTSICVSPEPRFLAAILNSSLSWWIIRQTASAKLHGYYEFKPMYVSQIRIPNAEAWQKEIIERVVSYILFLKGHADAPLKEADLIVSYFESIIDALVYELFLTDELHAAGKEFFAHLHDAQLPDLSDHTGSESSIVRRVFERLSNRDHPIRYNLNFLTDLESVRLIEDKR